jgi:tetratricopeptide (TPR) repeat protein
MEEITTYQAQLTKNNFVVIEGMAGVGKTALSAELAWQLKAAGWKVFWLTFIRGLNDNIEAFVAHLAGFLAVVGGDDWLWKICQAELASNQPFDLSRKFELFLKSAERERYVLCLDDFHLVAEDKQFRALFQLLIKRFGGQRENYPMKFIIMSRQIPDYMVYLRPEYDELLGLSFFDTQAFLDSRGIQLDKELLENLYQRTEGNIQVLNLCIRRLQSIQGSQEKVEQFITNLQYHDQIQALMEDISSFLSKEEQLILSAISLFRQAAVDRPELEAVLVNEKNIKGLRDNLRSLIRWNIARQTEEGRVSLHNLVKEYAYAELDLIPRQRMHTRAGKYFEEKGDYLEASHHYYEARLFDAAAAALAGRTRLLLNQGHRELALTQLGKLRQHQADLTPGYWIATIEGLGDVYQAKSDYEAAIKQFEESIRLQRTAANPKGLAWAYNKLGQVYLLQGDFLKVAEACKSGLEMAILAEDEAAEAWAHLLLGTAYNEQGEAKRAVVTHQQSLTMAKALGDTNLTARSYMELGLDYERLNKYQEAAECHHHSLELFLELGDPFNAASTYSNLGGIYHDQELFDEALAYYKQGLTLASENGDAYSSALIKGNLGETYYMLGDYSQAESYWLEASAIAGDIGQNYFLTILTANLGKVKLALGELEIALNHSLQALELAREIGSGLPEAIAHRTLGEVYAQIGNSAQAKEHLQAAMWLSELVDSSLEQAKAKQSYGQFLKGTADLEERKKGETYLQEAKTIIEDIKATRRSIKADI